MQAEATVGLHGNYNENGTAVPFSQADEASEPDLGPGKCMSSETRKIGAILPRVALDSLMEKQLSLDVLERRQGSTSSQVFVVNQS